MTYSIKHYAILTCGCTVAASAYLAVIIASSSAALRADNLLYPLVGRISWMVPGFYLLTCDVLWFSTSVCVVVIAELDGVQNDQRTQQVYWILLCVTAVGQSPRPAMAVNEKSTYCQSRWKKMRV